MSCEQKPGNNRISEVDRLIHEPARYDIMALLYVVERADFLFVQNQIGLTPGNLSTHLTKLESAEYVIIEKEFVGRKPKTYLQLSNSGRKAFEAYRQHMSTILATLPVAGTNSGKE